MSAGTPALAAESNTRLLPSTFTRHVVASSREGWISQARWTTTSAPSNREARSASTTSARRQLVFSKRISGTRRATPRTSVTCSSSANRASRLVPTLPLAPVTTIRTVIGGLAVQLVTLGPLDRLGLGVRAGMRLARARRARAGGTPLLAALRGYQRVGALVERVGPLGGIGIARRLAEGAVRLGRALGHGALLFLTPAVGVAVVLGHGTSFLVTLRRSPAGDRRARAQGATRGAGGRKPSSETKRRGDAPKGAEVGAITQHEHVGRLPHGGLDRLLEHARARLELFPVHRAALGVDAHPAAAGTDHSRGARALFVEQRLDA